MGKGCRIGQLKTLFMGSDGTIPEEPESGSCFTINLLPPAV